MSTAIMTPEDVMDLGRRIVLFPESKKKGRETYIVEDGRLTKKEIVWSDGIRSTHCNQSVSIEDIYPNIEMVFNRKTRGTLIARRSGNRVSIRKYGIPLKFTPKGMQERMRAAQRKNETKEVIEEIKVIRKIVKKNQKQRFYQEQHG